MRPVLSLCLKAAPMVTVRIVSSLGAQKASVNATFVMGTGDVG
jgi:hypothetical protein